MPPQILLIDKPKGLTSFDVVAQVRKRLGVKKVGHAGTLDPLATGLLILGIGEGTKKLTDFLKLPKTYKVDILIGEKRTTGDMEGEITEEKEVGEDINEGAVRKALGTLVGSHDLPIPLYSAIKREGEPLYKKARRGESIEEPVRAMVVTGARFLNLTREGKKAVVSAECDVESGVYIRSVAEELGRRLSYPATLKDLRRTRIGDFRIEDAQELKRLTF